MNHLEIGTDGGGFPTLSGRTSKTIYFCVCLVSTNSTALINFNIHLNHIVLLSYFWASIYLWTCKSVKSASNTEFIFNMRFLFEKQLEKRFENKKFPLSPSNPIQYTIYIYICLFCFCTICKLLMSSLWKHVQLKSNEKGGGGGSGVCFDVLPFFNMKRIPF